MDNDVKFESCTQETGVATSSSSSSQQQQQQQQRSQLQQQKQPMSALSSLPNQARTSRPEAPRIAGKRKVNFITVEEKYKAIKALERKETTLMQLCAKLNVGKSTVFGWVSQKEKIVEEYENNPNLLKRMKARGTSKYKEIEELVIDWLKVNKTNGLAISGAVLTAKAEEFAQLLGDHEFSAKNGWLSRFSKKYQHTLREIFNNNDPNAVDPQLAYPFVDNHSLGTLQMDENGDDNEDVTTLSSTTLDEERGMNKNGEFEDFNEVGDELFGDNDDNTQGAVGHVPSKIEVRDYIAKMRLYYQNKIDECNEFLKQLDVMESDL